MIRALPRLFRRLGRFAWRVVRHFFKNRGLLMAGGVAYNALLSAVPFFALAVAGLSYFFDEKMLLTAVAAEMDTLVPRFAAPVVGAVEGFLAVRGAVGLVGVVVLLFFSSIAFRMLEEALGVIFEGHVTRRKRALWLSALLPYVFIVVLGGALLAISVVHMGVEALGDRTLVVSTYTISLAGIPPVALRLLGFVSLVLLFGAIYKVLPVARIALRRAFWGGFAAAALWEGLGRGLVYYFSNISLVGVVYGSLATVIVLLLSMEIGTVVLLLGAQVIAELERCARVGCKWYEDPPPGPPRRLPPPDYLGPEPDPKAEK